MKRVVKVSFIAGVILSIAPVFLFADSPADSMTAEELVGRFNAATTVQKDELNKSCHDKTIFAAGIISDVKERSFLDEASGEQAETRYYVAVTELQRTSAGVIYNVVFCYKDEEDVKDIYKGQEIEKQGRLMKIFKEGVDGDWITVQLYAEGKTTTYIPQKRQND